MTKVMIQPADYDHRRQAVDRAFDLFPVKVRNKKVLVKFNALRAAAPDGHDRCQIDLITEKSR